MPKAPPKTIKQKNTKIKVTDGNKNKKTTKKAAPIPAHTDPTPALINLPSAQQSAAMGLQETTEQESRHGLPGAQITASSYPTTQSMPGGQRGNSQQQSQPKQSKAGPAAMAYNVATAASGQSGSKAKAQKKTQKKKVSKK